jgi:hypothetical protein
MRYGAGEVVPLHRLIGSACLARNFNTRAPAEIGTAGALLVRFLTRTEIIGLPCSFSQEHQDRNKAKASERKPAFHVVTTYTNKV